MLFDTIAGEKLLKIIKTLQIITMIITVIITITINGISQPTKQKLKVRLILSKPFLTSSFMFASAPLSSSFNVTTSPSKPFCREA